MYQISALQGKNWAASGGGHHHDGWRKVPAEQFSGLLRMTEF